MDFTEEELIEDLKQNGLDKPAVVARLGQWTDLAEAERDQIERGPLAQDAGVDHSIRVATLYSNAKLTSNGDDLADEAWIDAYSLAKHVEEKTRQERLMSKVVLAAKAYGYNF